MANFVLKQKTIVAEQYTGDNKPLGHDVFKHNCDYRMCPLCGGAGQDVLFIDLERDYKTNHVSIRVGDYVTEQEDRYHITRYEVIGKASFEDQWESEPQTAQEI